MVSLIFIVCLAVTPDICREEQPSAYVASPMSRAAEGQLICATMARRSSEMDAARLAVSVRNTRTGA
jgi:hypothetical protein